MGKGGVEQQAFSPLEYLEELCAYALSLGMPLKEYWNDDPMLLNNYVRAEAIRQRKRNTELWLQGAYVYQAVGALVPVLNPFSKEHRAKPYLKQPIPISEEERAEQEREKYERFVEYMMKRVEVSKK